MLTCPCPVESNKKPLFFDRQNAKNMLISMVGDCFMILPCKGISLYFPRALCTLVFFSSFHVWAGRA